MSCGAEKLLYKNFAKMTIIDYIYNCILYLPEEIFFLYLYDLTDILPLMESQFYHRCN